MPQMPPIFINNIGTCNCYRHFSAIILEAIRLIRGKNSEKLKCNILQKKFLKNRPPGPSSRQAMRFQKSEDYINISSSARHSGRSWSRSGGTATDGMMLMVSEAPSEWACVAPRVAPGTSPSGVRLVRVARVLMATNGGRMSLDDEKWEKSGADAEDNTHSSNKINAQESRWVVCSSSRDSFITHWMMMVYKTGYYDHLSNTVFICERAVLVTGNLFPIANPSPFFSSATTTWPQRLPYPNPGVAIAISICLGTIVLDCVPHPYYNEVVQTVQNHRSIFVLIPSRLYPEFYLISMHFRVNVRPVQLSVTISVCTWRQDHIESSESKMHAKKQLFRK
jgi:hypothetical protein